MWRGWYKAGLDVLFPPACIACEQPVEHGAAVLLCCRCMESVHYIQSPLCLCCGKEFVQNSGSDRICGACLAKTFPFKGARALVLYAPPVSTLIHKLKYNGDTSVLLILSELAKWFDFTFFEDCEAIVPVPLHKRRLKARGLNQSLLLAQIFFPGASSNIFTDALVRIRDTQPQTGLGKDAREKNLHAAFAVKKQIIVRGKRICLVDDVLTTGTTINECCKTLLKAGVKEVKVLTMSRVAEPFMDK